MTPDPEDAPMPRGVLAAALMLVAGLGAVDIVSDTRTEGLTLHIVLELAIVVASLGLLGWLARGWNRAAREAARQAERARDRAAELGEWRRRAEQALAGIAAAMEEQFEAWGLTPAERETAGLLVRGMSHKEVAAATGRSERTVRQHAVAAYRKAGVAGRAELAGFFLGGPPAPPTP